MAVDAIPRGIQPAAREPFRERERPLQDLPERLEPGELLRALAPEPFWILFGAAVQGLVLSDALYGGGAAEFLRRRETARFAQDRLDILMMLGLGHRLYPPACFTGLEAQVERGGVADLAPVRPDLAQAFEQLGLDADRELRRELNCAGRP